MKGYWSLWDLHESRPETSETQYRPLTPYALQAASPATRAQTVNLGPNGTSIGSLVFGNLYNGSS